jgi:SAM-dependent methyltransferase
MNTVFDSSADWYSHYYLNRNSRKSAQEIKELLKPFSKNKITDLGCGTGEITNALSDLGFQLKGIDPSPRMIEIAKNRFGSSKVQWEVGDLSTVSDGSIMYGYAYFHVANYILAEMNLFNFLSILKQKLSVKGSFAFDYWRGESISAGGLESRSVNFDIDGVSHSRSVTPIENVNGRVTIEIKVTPNNLRSTGVSTHENHILGTFLLNELQKTCELLNLNYSIHAWGEKELNNTSWDAVCLIKRSN